MMGQIDLINYVTSKIGQPFKSGENDCHLFICGCIDAFTGSNLHAQYKGKWTDEKSAVCYVKTHGNIIKHLLRLGFKRVNQNQMQIGDVIISEDCYGSKVLASSVFLGDKVAALTIDGLCFTQINQLREVKGVYRCQR